MNLCKRMVNFHHIAQTNFFFARTFRRAKYIEIEQVINLSVCVYPQTW